MFEKMMNVPRTKLMWALGIVGVNSLFVNGTLQVILNVVIFFLAIWVLLILRRQKPDGHH